MQGELQAIQSQIVEALQLFRFRRIQVAVLITAMVLTVSTLIAPDTEMSTWDWLRLILILVTSVLAILMLLATRDDALDRAQRQTRLLGVATLVVLALILNISFGFDALLLYCLTFSALAVIAHQDAEGRSGEFFLLTSAVLLPIWLWTALNAWDDGLLLLFPLGVFALISHGHIRSSTLAIPERALGIRAHRFASWLGILGSALLTVLIGVFSSVDNSWVLTGALVAIIAVICEAALPRQYERFSIVIVDLALVWVAFCWMVAL